MAGPRVPATGFFVYNAPQGWSQYYLNGKKLLSVSKVKEAIGTGDGLQRWAASMERAFVLAKASAVYERVLIDALDSVKHGGTLAALPIAQSFAAEVANALGREFAYDTYRDEQADIGKAVHAELEEWYNARLADVAWELNVREDVPNRDAVTQATRAALDFMEKENVVPLAAERPVYSERLGVGGRLDKIVLVRGLPAILDWKATKSVHYTAKVTTAAYRLLYNECPEKLIGVPRLDRALIVQLPKVAGALVQLHAIGREECDSLNDVFEHAVVVRRGLDAADVFDGWRKKK